MKHDRQSPPKMCDLCICNLPGHLKELFPLLFEINRIHSPKVMCNILLLRDKFQGRLAFYEHQLLFLLPPVCSSISRIAAISRNCCFFHSASVPSLIFLRTYFTFAFAAISKAISCSPLYRTTNPPPTSTQCSHRIPFRQPISNCSKS